MKKLLCMLAALAMLISMSACNSENDPSDVSDSGDTTGSISTSDTVGDTEKETTTPEITTATPDTTVADTVGTTETIETEPPRDWDATLPQQVVFTAELSTTYDDGGYYAKFDTFTVENNDKNGVKVSSPNSDGDRCLWAFMNEVVDARPILHYELEEGSAIYKIEISRAWDIEMPIEIDIDPGAHTLNLKEALEQHSVTLGYSYVVIYTSGDANINNFYLGTE